MVNDAVLEYMDYIENTRNLRQMKKSIIKVRKSARLSDNLNLISESYVAGAHCVLSRHGERFAWVVKREKLVRLLQSSLEGYEGRRQFYIRW